MVKCRDEDPSPFLEILTECDPVCRGSDSDGALSIQLT
jgi:hypothetical protein